MKDLAGPASFSVTLREGADLAGFRQAVRGLIAAQALPSAVIWSVEEEPDIFGSAAIETAPPVVLPRAVGVLIEGVVCHRDPQRFALLYTLIWRVLQGERALPAIASDPLVHRLEHMRRAVHRDIHKMHAFLRFRRSENADGTERYAAWFEPDHHILEAAAPFFVERFGSLIWSIFTPLGSLHWDRENLVAGPAGLRRDIPEQDDCEAAWLGYYESIFNPARINPKAMRTEMPQKYWRNMPEAQAIPDLIRTAPQKMQAMIEREAAVPSKRNPDKAVAAMVAQKPQTLTALNRIIAASEPLTPGADRAVLGEGPIGAAIAFVGEQPGDQEEREGHPFVGPAGQLLNRAMQQAGIDRTQVYVTNAVKHFKYEERGKRRLHKKPSTGEVKRYRWWLIEELSFVRPHLVVALGSTAALALAGKAISVTQARGEIQFGDFAGYVTVHPSYLLRLPDEAAKQQAYAQFCADLERIRDLAA